MTIKTKVLSTGALAVVIGASAATAGALPVDVEGVVKSEPRTVVAVDHRRDDDARERRAERRERRDRGLVEGVVLHRGGGGVATATGSGPAPTATTAPAPTGGSGGAGGHLESIASCESGGDPTAVSPDGTYRGKYQFDQQTWNSVGGTGDPAAAPESVQDEMAQRLIAQRGSSPWPNCG